MKNRDIDEIIFASLNGKGTKQELDALKDWIQDSDENQRSYENLKLIWKEKSSIPKVPNSHELVDKIWGRATGQYEISQKSRVKNLGWKKYTGIAAAISLLAMVSIAVFNHEFGNEEKIVQSGQIIQKSTAAGQKLQVTLPDSSVVWINSESSIRYPEHFAKTSRTVHLSGEAYFDVQKDPTKTFEVVTDNLTVKALGTSFNVNAFDNQNETKVALVEGKVEIVNNEALTVLLAPGELGIYNTTQKVFKKGKSLLAEEVSWKDGIITFNNSSEELVLARLEKWYGVKIVIRNQSPRPWNITAEYANLSLENVLQSLSYAANFEYTINKKKVTLTY
jgi:transmembrane sensor